MWLLDANVPKQLAGLLSELGVPAETAQARGWGALDNGTLVGVSVAAGFTCLLTRDRLFGESAGRALEQFPEFAIIVVTLPQARAPRFLKAFRSAWTDTPIVPRAGEILDWPTARKHP